MSVSCKVCKNECRLVIPDVLTVDGQGLLVTYNLWQCDECGSMFRELLCQKQVVGNHIIELRGSRY